MMTNNIEKKKKAINRDIGLRISQQRRKLGMTQVQLAKKVGFSEKWIQQIEYGKTEPSVSKIIIFANALNTDPKKLIGANLFESEVKDKNTEAEPKGGNQNAGEV